VTKHLPSAHVPPQHAPPQSDSPVGHTPLSGTMVPELLPELPPELPPVLLPEAPPLPLPELPASLPVRSSRAAVRLPQPGATVHAASSTADTSQPRCMSSVYVAFARRSNWGVTNDALRTGDHLGVSFITELPEGLAIQ
jgi:hypothetical protein